MCASAGHDCEYPQNGRTDRDAVYDMDSVDPIHILAFGGTGLCSYRVRGVDGSCAEHLTVESYTIIISVQSYLLLLVFHHPLTLSL